MYNQSVKKKILECKNELMQLKTIINEDKFDQRNRFLILYAIIRATGTLEVAYKRIIVDSFDSIGNERISNYLEREIAGSSKNPSYSNLVNTLKKFDDSWSISFKQKINDTSNKAIILEAIKNLNELRNSFAHGGSPNPTIDSINDYFESCIEIIEIYDDVIHSMIVE